MATVRLNPADDPLYRGTCGPGRCPPGILDFVDAQLDPDGRPWAVLIDACRGACAAAGAKAADSDWNGAFLATLAEGNGLLDGKPLPPVHAAKP